MLRTRATNTYFPRGSATTENYRTSEKVQIEELLAKFYLPKANLNFSTSNQHNDWCSVGVASAQGWRPSQEDAHLADLTIASDQALFGIFDGHNGPEVAQYAAEALPDYLKKNDNFKQCNYVSAFQESFLEIDAQLVTEKTNANLLFVRQQSGAIKNKKQPECGDSLVSLRTGSTAVVALVSQDKQIYVANIGDSRCIVTIKDKVVELSEDHRPTDKTEKRRIEQAGFYVAGGRINHCLNLSRAFGDHIFKNNPYMTANRQAISAFPDVTICDGSKMRRNDFIVIACDGIWNCLSNKKVAAFVKKHIDKQECDSADLSGIARKLIEKCITPSRPMNGQSGGDNMTCMIIKFNR